MSKRPLADEADRRRHFEDVFRSTHSRVLAYALRRSPDRESAEEVVSETFLIAWRKFDAVPVEHPLPWLLGTARRVRSNQRRDTARRPPSGGPSPRSDADIPAQGTATPDALAERDAFNLAFTALRERDREILTLVAWDGLRTGEAAAAMGCTSATFSIRLHRARRRLLKELRRTGHALGEASQEGQHPVERPEAREAS